MSKKKKKKKKHGNKEKIKDWDLSKEELDELKISYLDYLIAKYQFILHEINGNQKYKKEKGNRKFLKIVIAHKEILFAACVRRKGYLPEPHEVEWVIDLH